MVFSLLISPGDEIFINVENPNDCYGVLSKLLIPWSYAEICSYPGSNRLTPQKYSSDFWDNSNSIDGLFCFKDFDDENIESDLDYTEFCGVTYEN